MSVTIGSLFSGIGGLELGLEWAGLGPVLWQCEIDPFCRAVLAKHWPHVTRYDDVTARREYPAVDLICGGFPCTDVSSAGKRRGLGGQSSGLWYHFASVIERSRPSWVVVENVASGAAKWLRPIRHQLHLFGYRTRALGIAAADVGAPHLRRRVFVVAHTDRDGEHAGAVDAEVGGASAAADADGADVWKQRGRSGGARGQSAPLFGGDGYAGVASDAAGFASRSDSGSTWDFAPADAHTPRREGPGPDAHEGWSGPAAEPWRAPVGGLVPVVHGLSGGLAGRRRRRSIAALGNAVVPQCAQVVGEVIRQMMEASP